MKYLKNTKIVFFMLLRRLDFIIQNLIRYNAFVDSHCGFVLLVIYYFLCAISTINIIIVSRSISIINFKNKNNNNKYILNIE